MATITRECDYCGDEYEAKRKTSRFCSARHGAAYRRAAQTGQVQAPDELAMSPAEEAAFDFEFDLDAVGHVERATYLELQRTSLLGTVHGMTALAIAKDVDVADAASSRAVAARELRLTMSLARQVGNTFSPAAARGVADEDDDDAATTGASVPNLADMRRRSEARKAKTGG